MCRKSADQSGNSTAAKLTSMLLPVAVGFATFAVSTQLLADEPVAGFIDADLSGWEEKSFAGRTKYELETVGSKSVLKATAKETASVLYKRESIDVASTPLLDWEWKIDSVYDIDNEQTKSGDDFPARLYVTAKTGPLPWQTIAINYVWSSSQPIGSSWPSPYTENSMMVVVQSGPKKSGQWVSQKRNIVEDFKTFFDRRVNTIPGIAVMVDGDSAAQSGTAYFGRIGFSPQAPKGG